MAARESRAHTQGRIARAKESPERLVAAALRKRDTHFRLLATDISAEILGRAREGRFSQLEVNREIGRAHV